MIHNLIIFVTKYINRLLKIPTPELVEGEGASARTAELFAASGSKNALIVTDKVLVELGMIAPVIESLKDQGIQYHIFDQVTPDPDSELVMRGVEAYKSNGCDGIVAFGGGSPMDCSKAVAACVTKNKPAEKLAGLLRVRKRLPPLIAIPTTAGTGSEATLVAVITNKALRQKYTIIDPVLVPHYAILDAKLMTGLPPHITAATGMDALTHAVESYIGLHSNSFTEKYALEAVADIFTHLPTAYKQGDNLEARRSMAKASYNAGVAFTRTSVGYVHALAHQLGGFYHVPHGLANAVLLPHILDISFENCLNRYADLARCAGLATAQDSEESAARKFVDGVKQLNNQLAIPTSFEQLKASDIPVLAERAWKEANCDYPVPKVLSKEQITDIYQMCVA